MCQTDVCLRREEARHWLKDLRALGWFKLRAPTVKPAEMIMRGEIPFKIKNQFST